MQNWANKRIKKLKKDIKKIDAFLAVLNKARKERLRSVSKRKKRIE